MWIFTPIGFYSVVQHRDDPGLMLIRTRAVEDLENLFRFAESSWGNMVGGSVVPEIAFRAADTHLAKEPNAERITRYPIIQNPAADYAYRSFLPRTWWNTVASQLANAVDYPNFKDRVKEVMGPERAEIYLRVWSAMHELQAREEGLPGPHEGNVTAGTPQTWDWCDESLFPEDPEGMPEAVSEEGGEAAPTGDGSPEP
jgi:hypothetical protein